MGRALAYGIVHSLLRWCEIKTELDFSFMNSPNLVLIKVGTGLRLSHLKRYLLY